LGKIGAEKEVRFIYLGERDMRIQHRGALVLALLGCLAVVFGGSAAGEVKRPTLRLAGTAKKPTIPLATKRPAGRHLVRPQEEVVEHRLRAEGVISEAATASEVRQALADYYRRFAERSDSWLSKESQARIRQRDHDFRRDRLFKATTAEAAASEYAVQPVTAAVLAMAVDFAGTDNVDYFDADWVFKTATTTGPRRGKVPAPGPKDNYRIWYEPQRIEDVSFYEKLIFGREGVGRVRMDLTDPVDGQPGINLTGYTVQDYFDQVAGPGNVTFSGKVVGWVTVDHSQGYYGAPSPFLPDGGGDVPVAQLVADALTKFLDANPDYYNDTSPTAFWPQFDKNKDGVIDTFWIFHAGMGEESGLTEEDKFSIWSHSSDLRYYSAWSSGLKVYEGDPSTTSDDLVVGPYTIEPEHASLGIMVHELGHNLFQLPDLYTQDIDNSIGRWDSWGSGSHNGPLSGAVPAGMSLWLRYVALCADDHYCNWQEPLFFVSHPSDTNVEVLLGQLEETPPGTYKGVLIDLPDVEEWNANYAGVGKAAYTEFGKNEAVLNLDRVVSLPAGAPSILTFNSAWDIEEDWDYGFVLVSEGDGPWVALDDLDGVFREDNPFDNNLEHGLTGYGQGILRFDLARWAGKTVTVRLQYKTDEYVTWSGWWVDDLSLDGVVVDDFESAQPDGIFPNWTNSSPGWYVAPRASKYANYYMLEWRSETKYDRWLKKTGVTKQLDEDGWQVEFVPYNIPGALLYYRDGRYGFSYEMGENYVDSPSPGPKHMLLLVDMNPDPVILPRETVEDDVRMGATIGSHDAPLSLQAAPSFTLNQVHRSGENVIGPWTIDESPPVSLFDDANAFYAGLFFGAPCPENALCFRGNDSAVIPARGRYSFRFTDYGGTLQPDPGYTLDGFHFGTGRPGDEAVQHGVQVELLPGNDPRQNTIRLGYTPLPLAPNLEVRQVLPSKLLVGARSVFSVEIRNAGLAPTTKTITLTDVLPSGVSLLSGAGAGWTCSAEGQLVTCTRENPLDLGEMSCINLDVRVDWKSGSIGWNQVYVATEGDASAKNDITREYVPFADTRVLYFPQIADGAVPGGTFQTTVVLVNTGSEADVKVEFYDSFGREMLVNVPGLGSGSSSSALLEQGGSISYQTLGQGSFRFGYAKVIAPTSVNGTAVFSYTEGGITRYEAGVPAVSTFTDFSVIVDSFSNVRETGLALVNAGTANANVTLRLYDGAFNLKATRNLNEILQDGVFNPGDHVSRFAAEIFPEINSLGLEEGSITVQSDVPLAAVTLRLNDDPARDFPQDVMTLSAFPVISGRAETAQPSAQTRTFYFAQFADHLDSGVKLQTSLYFLNTNEASDVTMQFFDKDGKTMAVALIGQEQPLESLKFNLPRGQMRVFQTAGTGNGKIGYVKVEASGDVGGTAVFTFSENAVICYEAGVPASEPMKEFTVAAESSNVLKTGLAVVNAGTADASVTFRLYYPWFSQRAIKTISQVLPGQAFSTGRHMARFMDEIFTGVNMSGGNWIVTVESSQPLAAVTLRQHDDPEKVFPEDITIATTFPVVPGRASK
jgi:immune inhibitor A